MLIIRMLTPELLASLVAADERKCETGDCVEEPAKPACDILSLDDYRGASLER